LVDQDLLELHCDFTFCSKVLSEQEIKSDEYQIVRGIDSNRIMVKYMFHKYAQFMHGVNTTEMVSEKRKS
jgi:hypothetical protein